MCRVRCILISKWFVSSFTAEEEDFGYRDL